MQSSHVDQATIQPLSITCASSGCQASFHFAGGTVAQFIDAFSDAHRDGWMCLIESILDMTCPGCTAATGRTLLSHQVFREKLIHQPEWKQNIIVSTWSAMAHIHDDAYLRETDVPTWLHAFLGKETTVRAAHVRHSLEHLNWNMARYCDQLDAIQAARLAQSALAR